MLDNLAVYLTNYETFNHLKGHTLKKEFPDLEKEISKYQLALNTSTNKIQHTTKGQNYTRLFPVDNEHFYTISWDIEKAKEIIKRKKSPVYQMEVKDLWENVSHKNLDLNYINNVLSYEELEPIIVVFYAPLNAYIVIDGNHRLAKQYYKNRNGKISAYLLEPDDHLIAMCGEYYRVMYKINHNLQVLNNYVIGNLSTYEYTNSYTPEKGAMLLYKINSLKYRLQALLK